MGDSSQPRLRRGRRQNHGGKVARMPGPEDLPAEAQALLGTPCTEAPCDPCNPYPNVTCQVSDEGDRPTWIPAAIQNADAGHLIMVPSNGSGVIGALLAAL